MTFNDTVKKYLLNEIIQPKHRILEKFIIKEKMDAPNIDINEELPSYQEVGEPMRAALSLMPHAGQIVHDIANLLGVWSGFDELLQILPNDPKFDKQREDYKKTALVYYKTAMQVFNLAKAGQYLDKKEIDNLKDEIKGVHPKTPEAGSTKSQKRAKTSGFQSSAEYSNTRRQGLGDSVNNKYK